MYIIPFILNQPKLAIFLLCECSQYHKNMQLYIEIKLYKVIVKAVAAPGAKGGLDPKSFDY